jgi:hypothetical protein
MITATLIQAALNAGDLRLDKVQNSRVNSGKKPPLVLAEILNKLLEEHARASPRLKEGRKL